MQLAGGAHAAEDAGTVLGSFYGHGVWEQYRANSSIEQQLATIS
jgi:hypothetical protein